MSILNILSIAGSDPSGGAGIQADLKTIAALGGYGMAAITALTAQNTRGVEAVEILSPDFVRAQLLSVFRDVRVDAVKIGMLADARIVQVVAEVLQQFSPRHIVLDPVMVATSGDRLIDDAAIQTLKDTLIPLATIITPNIPEAEVLLRKAVLDQEYAALDLSQSFGGVAVLLKGGHLKGEIARDVLCVDGTVSVYDLPRVDTVDTHGTGCTLSSALAVFLAAGLDTESAVREAKAYVTGAIKQAGMLDVGSGNGPVWHGWKRVLQ
jgi:hydroxymethylpyrimidine/phosphomethylpyrimidine kinase